jgi:hypothetical protein
MNAPLMRERMNTIMFSKRDIFAVSINLQQFFSKDSLYLEKNYCKLMNTFGEKSLIVWKT